MQRGKMPTSLRRMDYRDLYEYLSLLRCVQWFDGWKSVCKCYSHYISFHSGHVIF